MNSTRHPGPERHGVSLLELLTVIVIIGSLMAIAGPRYANSAARYQADAAARQITTDLQLLRHAARTTSSSRTLTFHTSSDDYTIADVDDMGGGAGSYRTDLAGTYEAHIVAVDFGGDAQLTFDGYGRPDSGGTIVVSVGGEERAVVVDETTSAIAVIDQQDAIDTVKATMEPEGQAPPTQNP